ncbi:hypothetical protein C8Q75DRAFT_737015 [Abortiporus biennis]|nr:hypothetical protein C8Q75DRAFT_737015 [Abortiporus biennis]
MRLVHISARCHRLLLLLDPIYTGVFRRHCPLIATLSDPPQPSTGAENVLEIEIHYNASTLSSHPPFGESSDIPRLGFGYLRDDKWLREFALKHHEVVPPTLVDKVDLDIKATEYLMVQLEQMMRMSIKIDGTYYHVFYLGTNKTKEHLKRAMNLENVDQLKRLFDTEEDPKWIRINHTIWSTLVIISLSAELSHPGLPLVSPVIRM